MRQIDKREARTTLLLMLAFVLLTALGLAAVHTAMHRVELLETEYTEAHEEIEYEAGPPRLAATRMRPATPVILEDPEPEEAEPFLRDDIPMPYDEQRDLHDACVEFDVPFDLVLSLIEQETRYRNVMGDGGKSAGYMQIQRRWWSDLMAEIGAEDLTVPRDNFRTGCAILRYLLDRFDGCVEYALTAYNTGSGGTSRYADDIMGRLK